MVVVEVDAHKRTDTLVAIDDAEHKLAEKTVAATPKGHLEAEGNQPSRVRPRLPARRCRGRCRRMKRPARTRLQPPWPTRAGLYRAVLEYIESWYNTRRLQSTLGYVKFSLAHRTRRIVMKAAGLCTDRSGAGCAAGRGG